MTVKRYSCIAAALLAAMPICGSPLSPGESLERALSDAPMKLKGTGAAYALAMTRESAAGQPGVYLFSDTKTGAFLLTSADDFVPALLGYGDTALDSSGNPAPGFVYWMDALAREVSYASENSLGAPSRAATDRTPIAPMCATKWNQDAPYNDMCPVINGRVSVTGCTATATAQVFKYHNWPPAGTGIVSYNIEGFEEPFSMNLADAVFDWDNMLDVYDTKTATQEQRDAVALLMKAVGYAFSMIYSPEASGAPSYDMARAIAEHFSYDKRLRFLYRDWYALTEWNDMIYASLSEYGPIIYNGQSESGGHSFVCDGYDKDDYFHINWGWGGISDGYFLLNVLDPWSQGIGGSGTGFNYNQCVVCDIRPQREGESEFTPLMAVQKNMSMKVNGGKVVIPNLVYNSGPGVIMNGWIGMEYSPVTLFGYSAGDVVYDSMPFEKLDQTWGYTDIDSEFKDLPSGRYEVRLKYALKENEWRPLMVQYGSPDTFGLTVSDGKGSVGAMHRSYPEVIESQLPSSVSAGTDVEIPVKLANNTYRSFLGNITALILPAQGTLRELAGPLATVGLGKVSLGNGKEDTVVITGEPKVKDTLAEGDYRIVLAMEDGAGGYKIVSEPQSVRFTVPAAVTDVEDGFTGGVSLYYNLEGVCVAKREAGGACPELPARVYIVHTGTHVCKVTI